MHGRKLLWFGAWEVGHEDAIGGSPPVEELAGGTRHDVLGE